MANCSTVCAYYWLVLVMLWEFSTMIVGVVLIPDASSCFGGVGLVTMPAWIFINGLSGGVASLFVLAFYATKICDCDDSSSSNGNRFKFVPDIVKTICFWASISTPMLFRLIWAIIGAILVASAPSGCAYRPAMVGLCVVDLLFIAFALAAMAKLACSTEINK